MKKQLLLIVLICTTTFHLLHAGEEALDHTWRVLNAAIMENRTHDALAVIPSFIGAGGDTQVHYTQILTNTTDQGVTTQFFLKPLALATFLGRLEVVKSLIANGAHPQFTRVEKHSPAMGRVVTTTISLLNIAHNHTADKAVYHYLEKVFSDDNPDQSNHDRTKRKRR